MNDKLRAYIDSLFMDAPKTKKTVELKEEMVQNLIDKYNDILSDGKSEDAAFNIAVASVGDVSELIKELEKSGSDTHTAVAKEQQRKRSAAMIAVSIALYIMSVIPLFILQNEYGLILMFVFVAVATGVIIYAGMTRPKYHKIDDTLVEEFKEWKATNSVNSSTFKAISSAIWMITVAVYIAISFLTGAWHITWIIFLIASAVISIVKALFDLKK